MPGDILRRHVPQRVKKEMSQGGHRLAAGSREGEEDLRVIAGQEPKKLQQGALRCFRSYIIFWIGAACFRDPRRRIKDTNLKSCPLRRRGSQLSTSPSSQSSPYV
ncbi:hypothetical protein J6590_060862 [Homalodisca vitripennis]|nr:hypothetical protein J6590_060862 [Homalodisca vitripennis]